MPSATPDSTPAVEATQTPPAPQGELRLVVRENVRSLNPFTCSNGSELLLTRLVYDTLLDSDSQLNLSGNLAQRWEFHPDGRSLTFWIDPRARWHDGQPVTADDVVYSFNLVRKEQFAGWVALAALVDRVEARSAAEVHFSLLSTQSDVTRQLGMRLPIVPAHVWQGVSEPGQFDNLANAIGSGPFRLTEHLAGVQTVLSSTTHHHSPARVHTLVFQIVRNEDQALQLLRDGKVDLLGWDVGTSVANTVKQHPQAFPGIVVSESQGAVVSSLILNLRRAPLNDVRFRRALILAIDVPNVITETLHGFSEPALPSLFPGNAPWRLPSITPVPFDKAQAAGALDTLGFTDRNNDGIREGLDGARLQITVTCADMSPSVQQAQLVASFWKAVGIGVTVTRVPQDAVLPKLMEAQFDVALSQIALQDTQAALLSFHSAKGMMNGGTVFGANYGGYNSAVCDDVLTRLTEEHDPVRQRELYAALQTIIAQDLPQIGLCCPSVLNLYREDRFMAWTPTPGIGMVSRSALTTLIPN